MGEAVHLDTYQFARIVRYQLAGFACLARIVAMQAANEARVERGAAQAYDEESFAAEAVALEQMAVEVLNG